MLKDATVVFGGGGVWGVAWMTGLAKGLAETGLDLSHAEGFIGTSAGSVVSTQLASRMSIDELYTRQVDPDHQPREPLPSIQGLEELGELLMQPTDNPEDSARKIGRLAMQSATKPYSERRRDIAERLGLPSEVWPDKALKITAVDAETGRLEVFDASSGVNIIDAVAASCAVPCIWPTTPINGRHYIDGGVWRTPENAHLAVSAMRAIVVSPIGTKTPSAPHLESDILFLESQGTKVLLISPDPASEATSGPNVLDPAVRKPAAEGGRNQGRLLSQELSRSLNDD